MSHYSGFGSVTVHVVEGNPVNGVSLSLAPVAQGKVEGTISVKPALAGVRVVRDIWLAFSSYDWAYLGAADAPPGSVAWVVPSVPGAEAFVRVATLQGSWHKRRVAVPSSGLAFDVPAPPLLVEPADPSVLADSTVFRWNPPETGGSSLLSLRCDWVSDGFRSVNYYVEAEGSEATLPAIPDFAVPSGAGCRWTAQWCAATDPAVEERCSSSAERHLSR